MLILEPWAPADRLLFLIEGVREALVHAATVEQEQLHLLGQLGIKEVTFVSDVEIPSREPLQLTGIRDEKIQSLAKLLHDLEREVRS